MNALITEHAAQRYQERVKSGLDLESARAELQQLLTFSAPNTLPPKWVLCEDDDHKNAYAEITDGIVVALRWTGRAYVATTVLTRSTPSDTARARRNALKQSRRYGRRLRNKGKEGRRDDRRSDEGH